MNISSYSQYYTQNIARVVDSFGGYSVQKWDVPPTWVAKLASWYMKDPLKMQNLVYEWVSVSKFEPI